MVLGQNHGSFVLAGTGIPEEFLRNLEESGEIAGQMQEFIGIGQIPVNMAKNRNFLTPAKRRFL
jgi:hypothetical protein